LRQVGGFSPATLVFSTNKTDHHNIAEILMKVALNTITQNLKWWILAEKQQIHVPLFIVPSLT
jgi:hypothetical protein